MTCIVHHHGHGQVVKTGDSVCVCGSWMCESEEQDDVISSCNACFCCFCCRHGKIKVDMVMVTVTVMITIMMMMMMMMSARSSLHVSVFILRICSSRRSPRNPRLALIALASSSRDNQRHNVEPPRITSNVKLNLQFLKRVKEKSGGAKPSTGYRRKKMERDISLDDEGQDNTSSYDSSSYVEIELTRPVLLVDGYNMCGYWPKLKKHFKRGHLDYARQTLLEELVTYGAVKGTKVVVVFDAATSGLPDHKETFQGVDIIFTATNSADTWIEREVGLLKEDGCPKVWVVTSDSIQQQCASASGAFVWSCKFLISMINDAKVERNEILRDMTSYSMKGRFLEDNLDPKIREQLKELKKQLLQAEKDYPHR